VLSDFLQPVGEALLQVVFYFFGRIIVPMVSLGNWHCEPFLSEVPRQETRWGGLFHYRGRQIYFTSEGTAAVGVVFCFLVVAAGFLIRYLSRN